MRSASLELLDDDILEVVLWMIRWTAKVAQWKVKRLTRCLSRVLARFIHLLRVLIAKLMKSHMCNYDVLERFSTVTFGGRDLYYVPNDTHMSRL